MPATRYPFTIMRQRLREHAGDALDFAIGAWSDLLPGWLEDDLRTNAHLATRRASHEDLEACRGAVAGMFDRVYGVTIQTDRILPAPGGRCGIATLISCLLEPNDDVLVTEPGYPVFRRLAEQAHTTVHAAELDPDNGFGPDVRSLARRGVRSIKLAALNYPNNPTGAVLSSDLVAQLQPVTDRHTVIFNDAIYGPLVYESRPVTALTLPTDQPVYEMHALSKLYPLGPLALAFIIGPLEGVQAIRDRGDYAWTPLSALHVRVATRCLEDTTHLDEVVEDRRRRMNRLREVLSDLGFQPYATPAGQYMLCRVPRRIGDHAVADSAEASGVLLDHFSVAAMPWQTERHGYLRFSSLYREQDLAALAQLADAGLRVTGD